MKQVLNLVLVLRLRFSGMELNYGGSPLPFSPQEWASRWVGFLKQGLKVADLLWFRRGCCHLALESQVPIVTGHL